MQVLIADDDPVARHLLRRTLESWNYTVTAVENGDRAWEVFLCGDYSLVILDWVMPGLSGPELVQRIRNAPRPSYVYTLLLTASNDPQEFIQGLTAGADDFLVKPLVPEVLRARLRSGERILRLEQTLLENNRRLEERNREMQADLRMACELQQALLPQGYPSFPPGLPPERSRLRFFDRYRPTSAVGGDLFDVIALGDFRAGVLICDVQGHGVRAAMGTAMIRALLEHIRRLADEPAHFLEELNRELVGITRKSHMSMEISAFYGLIDLAASQMQYVSAAHPEPVLSRAQEVRLLPQPASPTSPPLGRLEHVFYPHGTVKLEAGDRLVLYTDGLIQAFNPSDESFGQERLCQAIRTRREIRCAPMLDEILTEVTNFTQGRDFSDDVCLVAAEIR